MNKLFVAGVLWAVISAASAQDIVGKWKTIDDHTGRPKSIVRIEARDGAYFGKVESLMAGVENRCVGCTGAQKDAPIINMTVLSHLKDAGEGEYKGGQIFDPKSGKTYQSKAKLVQGGKKLEVRGFVGVSLIGRTQTWERVE